MKVKNEKTEQVFCNFHFVLEPFQPHFLLGSYSKLQETKKRFFLRKFDRTSIDPHFLAFLKNDK